MYAASAVWIINSQHWPRAYLRAELLERGCDAIGFVTLSQALAALHHPGTLRPRAIVLELRGPPPARSEELSALARTGIPTIILGGAIELNEKSVGEFGWAAVIKRPFTIGTVADVVEDILEGPSDG